MKRTICIILALILTLGALPFAISANDEPFTDVKPDDWFYGAAKFCREKGIFYGDRSGALNPQNNMTRAQFVQVLYAIEGCPTPKMKPDNDENRGYFCDIRPEKWYSNAVNWAYESKLIAGIGDDRFDPDAPLTREQAAVMLYAFTVNYKKSTSIQYLFPQKPARIENLDDYSDAKEVGPWARKALQWAIDTGLLSGTKNDPVTNLPDYIAPKGVFTRGQAVVVFTHFYSLVCENDPLVDKELKVTAYAYVDRMPTTYKTNQRGYLGIKFEGEGLTEDMLADVHISVWGKESSVRYMPLTPITEPTAKPGVVKYRLDNMEFEDGEQLIVNVPFAFGENNIVSYYQITLYPTVEVAW